MTHDEAVLLVPDLGRGRLETEEEAAVRAHLAACKECSGLADAYRLVTVALAPPQPDHPDVADLVAHAMRASSRPEVEDHLASCSSCSQQAVAVRAAEAELSRRRIPVRTWGAWAAVAALPLFIGYFGWMHLRVIPALRGASAPAETAALPLLAPSLRGREEPIAVPIARGQHSVPVAVAAALPRDLTDAEVLRIEMRAPGGGVVFSRDMTAGEVRRLSGTSGAFALVLPAAVLPDGDARLHIHSASRGELLAVPFRVRRE